MVAASRKRTSPVPHNRLAGPSANGANGAVVPSANGANGSAAPSANGDNGRDHNGRFTKGNPGGPGNPFARRLAELRRTLLATVTEEDVRAVTRRLVEQAQAGDVAAARLLLAYAIGQPSAVVDPDTLDLQEWDLLRQTPVKADEMKQALSGMPLELACILVRAALPHLTTGAVQIGREILSGQGNSDQGKKPAKAARRKAAGPAAGAATAASRPGRPEKGGKG